MESLEASLRYLESPEASGALARDPYWPKWNGPWWHMLLLHEMNMAKQIPAVAIDTLIHSLESNCLHFFPFKDEEVPPGKDSIGSVPCHCQLGTVYQVLTANGINVDKRLPWIRPWFLKYQLPDGGLNCDEAAYTSNRPKSSVVSTLPPLEAILYCTKRELTKEEVDFLDHGAAYLINKRLFRAESDGRIIDETWPRLCFPRFYHYDILRGLVFLLRWADMLNRVLPSTAIKEAVNIIENDYTDDRIYIRRSIWAGALTRSRNEEPPEWSQVPANSFPLLEVVGELGNISPYLSAHWHAAKKNMANLLDRSLIQLS